MGKRTGELPVDVRELLDRGDGIISTAAARDAGVEASRLWRLNSAGLLARLMPGTYTDAQALARLDRWQQFALRARAFALSCGPDTYLTGWAAAVIWRLPGLGNPPDRPTVLRPKASGRGTARSPYGRILVADLPAAHRETIASSPVTSVSWTVADLARTSRLPDSLVTADAATRGGADLHGAIPHMGRWPGVARARWVAEHADPAAESPLETLGRFTFIEFDLPLPVANAWVGLDRPEKRVDGLWPWHRCVLEGDGALKYDNRDDASEIVRAQNDREFYLRRLGLDFARYSWRDVYPSRAPLAGKCRALLRDNPARSEPVRWWNHMPSRGPVPPRPEDWPSPHPASITLPAGWNRDLGRTR